MVDPKRKASVSVQDSHLENPPKRPRTDNPPVGVLPQSKNPESPLVGPLLESHLWGSIADYGNVSIGNIEEYGSINTGNIEEHGSINTGNIEEHGNINFEDIFQPDAYYADSQLGDVGEQIFNQEAQQGEDGFVHEHINPSLLSFNQTQQSQPAVDTPASLFDAPDAPDDDFLAFFNDPLEPWQQPLAEEQVGQQNDHGHDDFLPLFNNPSETWRQLPAEEQVGQQNDDFLPLFNTPSETWQQPPAEEQVGQQNDHGQETLDQQDPDPTSRSPPSITTEQPSEAASDSRPMQQPPVNPLPPDPTPTGEQISEAPQPIQQRQVQNEPVSSNRPSGVQGSQVQPTQRNQAPLSTIQESIEVEDTVEPLEVVETGARRLNSAAPRARGRGRGRPRGRPAGRVALTTPRATPVATDENGNPIRAAFACDRCKHRKLKCDNNLVGCANCTIRNQPCCSTDLISGKVWKRGEAERIHEHVKRYKLHFPRLLAYIQHLEDQSRSLQKDLKEHGAFPDAILDPLLQHAYVIESAPQVGQGGAQPTATDMPPVPGSPERLVKIHTTSDFSAPMNFDKALAPPREGYRALLPEETASGRDHRRNEFDAFQRADEQIRRDASGQNNRQSELDGFQRADDQMRRDASSRNNRQSEFDFDDFLREDDQIRRDASGQSEFDFDAFLWEDDQMRRNPSTR
ncbi:hypothetical protein V8E54_012520 [Elaphomyces granulatus]